MEPTVKKIVVTVSTTTNDGYKSDLVFNIDPTTFQMSQEREVKPVYGDGHKDWGRPVNFEIDPDRKGTRLSLSGNVIKGGRYKWPG